jgi:methylisocitrate lyase
VIAVVDLPVLANLTEFGVTPAFTLDDLGAAGVRYVLYPLTVFRSMSAAAVRTLELLRADRQASALASMQTRAELYEVLDYDRWERRADADAALDDGGGE